MAPFTRGHCPVCLADTIQQFLLHDAAPQDADGELWAICESCRTVLMHRADGSVGQRAATAEELAAIPPKPDLSQEPWVTMREELRQGQADLNAWIHAGCPGLTREMLNRFSPSAVAALARHGVRLRDDGEATHQEGYDPGA
ncbi:MAG: hypothetical protein JO316_01470 [Abitibacteriaceae bacterium]|nr:hypothetical protein [Abditibacteriaceae bacterium]